METPAYKDFEVLFKILKKARATTFTDLIRSINNKVIRALIEIAFNLLKGNIPISDREIAKLRKFKKQLKILINTTVSIRKKRKILLENISLIKTMLKIIFK